MTKDLTPIELAALKVVIAYNLLYLPTTGASALRATQFKRSLSNLSAAFARHDPNWLRRNLTVRERDVRY